MLQISKEFDKIFETDTNCANHVYSTLTHLDQIGYLPFSFAIPPQYWENAYIEGYTEKHSKELR